MDADGQHDPANIALLLTKLGEGYDMVIGARSREGQANIGRAYANMLYNRLASWMVGHPIPDLTSGFRAVHAKKFKEFLYLLPNRFSYPTTITMSFFRAGYGVAYVPIQVHARIGKSHLSPLRDGARFFIIIFKIGTLYAPLKIFIPLSAMNFMLGVGYYLYTYINYNRFTNMSALLFISSLLIFLIGLVSEQITTLIYKDTN
jgi:glycosyltransferase involved in cell wall biosynthesis